MSEPAPAPPPAAPPPFVQGALTWIRRIENGAAIAALFLLGVLPVLEILLRQLFKTGLPGSLEFVQHLTLWVGFLGAMIASREKRHLALATGADRLPPRPRKIVGIAIGAVSSCVSAGLAWASWHFITVTMKQSFLIGGWLPKWGAQLILPIAFASMALRFVVQAEGWVGKGVALLGIPLAAFIGFVLEPYAGSIVWPGIVLILAAAALGAPIFVAMGGATLLLLFADGTPTAAIPVETYRLVTFSEIPMLPLFTLTGFLLAEGKASERLLRLFSALFGWMPGGLAIVATLVCAFFTTFTGASGVTILALGGLLLPMLLKAGYREPFSIGLLTSSGSIGLLFPPSLPVILYGVVAHVSIADLFVAGAIPGVLLVLAVAVFGIVEARRARVPRAKFELKEAGRAFWAAKWEVLLPIVAIVSLFGGFCTPVEAAAITVVYALIVQAAVHRELHPIRDLPRVFVTSIGLIGGVIAILGVAMGLTNYLIFAEVPMKAAEWVQANIHSRFVFLLVLNLFLIVVGALMDIYSAITVIVPLIVPVAEVFQIDPIHLGIIFLANLELGYLVPPVGENLFLSSYRFNKPILRVARYVVPFAVAILIAVLVITYVPGLSLLGKSATPGP